MKKIHLIVQKRDIPEALEGLSELEAVHVEHQKNLAGPDLFVLREEVGLLKRVLQALEPYNCPVDQAECSQWRDKASEIMELSSEVDVFTESINKLSVLIEQWKPWGNFKPQDIRDLAEKGIFIKLCKVPAGKQVDVPEGMILKKIFTADKFDHCMVISRSNDDLPFTRVYLPECGVEEMKQVIESEKKEIESLKGKLAENCKYVKCFKRVLAEHQEALKFEEVACGMEEQESLSFLKGFCPENRCQDLEAASKEKKWGLIIDDIGPDDQVPTLLKNPKWVDLIKPVFKLIEVVPGYKEFDVSLIFLVFFTLFFGMLVGDAAYAAIYFIMALVAHIALKDKFKDNTIFVLLYILSGFTMIWGVLTGTYFGQQWLPESVKPIVPWLNDYTNIQFLCFTIAVIHLSIARIWSAVSKLPSLKAVSDVGWLMIVWGMYFYANLFVLNKPLPPVANWLIMIGAPLGLLFIEPNKNFLKASGSELIPFLLSVIGAFTDVVSYIRLFAVGMATVAVADATNSMAATFGVFSVGGIIALLIGHILNLILAAMAVLVHAVRLNVLEFSGHLNLQWTGVEYNPFKRNIKLATNKN